VILCITTSNSKHDTQHFRETCVSFSVNDILIHKRRAKWIFSDFWQFPWWAEALIIAVFVGVFATNGLTKWFINPIKKVGPAMEKIAEGDFSVRLDTKSNSKEIREIISGFNMMAHELQSTEILKSDFVSTVSHEFKTPISAIEGYSMLLQKLEQN
jgi:signal transduction histidine kinase